MTTSNRSYTVTAREAARQLQVHVETIKRWCRDGKVPAKKNFAGVWLLNQDDIDSLPVHEVQDD